MIASAQPALNLIELGRQAVSPCALPPLAEVPLSLVWAIAILTFGVLLTLCVLMVLRRETDAAASWDMAMGPAARRGQHLQHLSRLLRSIRTINSLVVAERDGQRLLEKACSSLTTTRGYRMAWIGTVQEGDKRVHAVAQTGFEEGYLDQVDVTWDDSPTGRGPTGQAIKTAEPSVMRDIETAPEYEPWRQQALERGYRSSAALPLRFRGEVLGTLNVYADMPDAFDIEEVGLLQEVADHLAYALGSIGLESELIEARRDMRRAEQFRSAFENTPAAILVTDKNGVITSLNRWALQMLDSHQTAAEVVGRVRIQDLDIFDPQAGRSCLEDVLERGRPARFECSTTRADGSQATLAWRGEPTPKDKEERFEAVWVVSRLETP